MKTMSLRYTQCMCDRMHVELVKTTFEVVAGRFCDRGNVPLDTTALEAVACGRAHPGAVCVDTVHECETLCGAGCVSVDHETSSASVSAQVPREGRGSRQSQDEIRGWWCT